jgi:endonuclease/exonuclease/phosphatase family metal-dependent hydrolase
MKLAIRKLTVIFLCFVLTAGLLQGQSLADLSYGSDETFEVITWNIEWFPKNGQITVDSVKVIIQALDADIYALQEIDDTTAFRQMIDNIPGYETYFESFWFAGLAYVYKSSTVAILDAYEIYYTEPYWSPFPRSPLVLEVSFSGQEFIIIDNHFKCCGNGVLEINDSGDEETRRLEASNLIKQYIDENLPTANVLVVGDLNDILTDDVNNNVFQSFLNDDEKYAFADMDIAEGSSSNWSFPGWPSHLDHILITNELFDDLANDASEVQTIKIEENMSGGFSAYDTNISDHRPVGLKLELSDIIISSEEIVKAPDHFSVYPNPARNLIHVCTSLLSGDGLLRIIDLNGNIVQAKKISAVGGSLMWHTNEIAAGLYLLQYVIDGSVSQCTRLIIYN